MKNDSSWDPVWEEVFRQQEWGKYPPEHVIRFVARNFYRAPDRKAIRLLDLGCGPGACTWYMAREGFSVAGIDGSATAISRAGERLSKEGLAADLRVGDFVTLPWDDGVFDGVVDNATLCCNAFENCVKVVSEVRRVLKPNGVFMSCNFTPQTWGFGTGQPVGPNEFVGVSEGPLAGKGLQFFMSREQVDELYTAIGEYTAEKISLTAENMTRLVELWVVTCRKTT